jgi:hypothetical protein
LSTVGLDLLLGLSAEKLGLDNEGLGGQLSSSKDLEDTLYRHQYLCLCSWLGVKMITISIKKCKNEDIEDDSRPW